MKFTFFFTVLLSLIFFAAHAQTPTPAPAAPPAEEVGTPSSIEPMKEMKKEKSHKKSKHAKAKKHHKKSKSHHKNM